MRVQQPDMLLLDRTHLEALLSGLLSPADLFTELTDRASYRGEIRVPLTDLLVPKDQPAPPVLGPGSPDGSVPVVTETAPGVRGDVVLHGTQPQETVMDGIAVDRDGRLPFALCPVVCHLVHTARVITAAAAIMIAVFITFVLTGQIRSL